MNENTSIATADRRTHVKVVAVALVAAIAVMIVGLTARTTPSAANLQASGPVIKASKVISVTRIDGTVIR